MAYSSRRGATDIIWRILVGVTFLSCCLLMYHFLTHNDVPCSTKTGCSSSSKHRTEKLRSEECSSVCNTKECIDISTIIQSNINQSADPCNDFYNFACGNFKSRYEIYGNHSSFERLGLDLFSILRDIIESSKEPYGTAMHKLKVVYDSCMNTGSSELKVTQTLLGFVRHLGLRNWPHLSSNFSFVRSQLPELLGILNSYNQESFFIFYPSYFDQVSSENNGVLHNLTVEPSVHLYKEKWEVKELEKVVGRILRDLGVDMKDINKTWDEFMTVHNQLDQLLTNSFEENDTCEDGSNFQSINCSEEKDKNKLKLCRVLESVIRNGKLASRFNKDQIHVNCQYRYYMDRIYGTIKNNTDRVIANYIALRVFVKNLKYMNFVIRKMLNVFIALPDELDSMFQVQLDKWKYCVAWVADHMQYPLGVMYVDKMWSMEAADELNNMVQELLNTTVDLLHGQQWIGESTKEEAVKEVKEEKNCIYSIIQTMMNKTRVNALYKRFNPSRSSFMRNVLMHTKHYFYLSVFHEDDMSNFYNFNAFGVNAFGGFNIYLTFGILLPPVFRYGYPNLFNFAKIGQIVGHEIGHKLFTFLESSTHVDNGTRETLKKKLDCLIDQYSRFEQKRIKRYLKGNETISENFPDNMSLQVIEKVSGKYLRNMKKSGFTLPGINYSPEELLYISYAQTWCAVRSIEKERYYHDNDVHSPPEFRIKGAFQNSLRFSEVFKCPKTSYMNSKKRCHMFE